MNKFSKDMFESTKSFKYDLILFNECLLKKQNPYDHMEFFTNHFSANKKKDLKKKLCSVHRLKKMLAKIRLNLIHFFIIDSITSFYFLVFCK